MLFRSPVFDAAGALDDMDGDAPLLCRLCLLFLEEAPAERAALVASIEAPRPGRRTAGHDARPP